MIQRSHIPVRPYRVLCVVGFVAANHLMAQTDKPEFAEPTVVPRIALVVGVQHYDHLDEVPNARRDAEDIQKQLRAAGFSPAWLLMDPNDGQLQDSIDDVKRLAGQELTPAEVVVFFAGHGFQINGNNFLVPANAYKSNVLELGVPVASVLQAVSQRGAGATILLLDACRSATPPRSEPRRNEAGQGVEEAFLRSDFVNVPSMAIVGMATKFGHTAHSYVRPDDLHSPYTAALLQYLPRRGMAVTDMFNNVRSLVSAVTQFEGLQEPEEVGGLGGRFYFVPAESSNSREEDRRTWLATLQTGQRACVTLYVARHPESVYLGAALRWLSEMGSRPQSSELVCPDN